MQTPTYTTPVSRLVAMGHFLAASLVQHAETADLAPAFAAQLEALLAAVAATTSARLAVVAPRVALRFAERRVELVIRNLALGVRSLDRGKAGGHVAGLVFPDGIVAETEPQGAAQLEAAERVMRRLQASTPAASLRAVHEPLLRDAIDEMRRSLDQRAAAQRAYDDTFQGELVARDTFVREYDRVANAIRSRFPKDREAQDVFFEELRVRRAQKSGGAGEAAAAPAE